MSFYVSFFRMSCYVSFFRMYELLRCGYRFSFILQNLAYQMCRNTLDTQLSLKVRPKFPQYLNAILNLLTYKVCFGACFKRVREC